MDIQKIGVVGAGIMGSALAQVLALTGHHVILMDISRNVMDGVRSRLKDSLRFQMMFDPELRKNDLDEIIERIEFASDYRKLAPVDFVLENVTEKWEIKQEVFDTLDRICSYPCVLATDTSAIPVTKIAALTDRPDRVIGMHFMNPVTLKSSVEMIRGSQTSDYTFEMAKKLLVQMKKEWILVKDSPGFVSNRVQMLAINEAICLLDERIASVQEIDHLFKSCFGHKMGPLETADMIGLDTVLNSLRVLCEDLDNAKFHPCPLLEKMVEDGRYGRKSGTGFYDYSI